MNCKCGTNAVLLAVKKEGPNKGKKFYTCNTKTCDFFSWENKYDPKKFKNGACFRCGRYGCYIEDCENKTDFYGNVIPDDYDKYF